jgi:hypothetical protein
VCKKSSGGGPTGEFLGSEPGAFERVWSAEIIARLAYKRPDITAIMASR